MQNLNEENVVLYNKCKVYEYCLLTKSEENFRKLFFPNVLSICNLLRCIFLAKTF